MRILIVDDEPPARRGVRARLTNQPDIEIVGECASGKDAVTAIQSLSPDLVFLDIQMPDLSGFDVLRQLSGARLPLVIFLTAYNQHALRAFEVHALDYLVKPIDDVRFYESIEHARTHVGRRLAGEVETRLRKLLDEYQNDGASRYETRFAVRTRQRISIVEVNDIDWIQASRDYVTLHSGKKSYLLRQSMNGIESQLDPSRFLRIHRSAIIQASRIRELVTLENREYLIRLSTGVELKSSRTYSDVIERWL
jgi:two-component system LytT family response regulator